LQLFFRRDCRPMNREFPGRPTLFSCGFLPARERGAIIFRRSLGEGRFRCFSPGPCPMAKKGPTPARCGYRWRPVKAWPPRRMGRGFREGRAPGALTMYVHLPVLGRNETPARLTGWGGLPFRGGAMGGFGGRRGNYGGGGGGGGSGLPALGPGGWFDKTRTHSSSRKGGDFFSGHKETAIV